MATGRPPTCSCGECQKCKHRTYMREWYQRKTPEERRAWVAKRDREKVRASDRRRYQKPERKAHAAEQARKWQEKHPEWRKAQYAVSNAVRDGRLTKGPCEICGAERVHGHHDDYSKPLEVRWLCPAHHAQHHAHG